MTGVFGVPYTVAPVNLGSTGPIPEPSPSCSTSIPGPFQPPVLSLSDHSPAPAWAALPLQLSPLSRLQSLPPPTKCLSAPLAPSGCWHESRAAGLGSPLRGFLHVFLVTPEASGHQDCCMSVFHILGASLC